MLDLLDISVIAGTAVTLSVANRHVMPRLRPKHIENSSSLTHWKWDNYSTSLVHSFVVGFGVLTVIAMDRSLIYCLIGGQSSAGNCLICISTGYFVYDLLLSISNIQYPGRTEIIVHHLITLSCLLVSLWQHRYLAYCLVGLTVEISSFFIHVRELSILGGVSNTSMTYAFNSLMTIVTLVLFRFVPLSWIAIGLYLDRDQISVPLLAMSVVFVAIIFLVSSVVLYRVSSTDLRPQASNDFLQWIGINSTKLQYKCSSKLRKVL